MITVVDQTILADAKTDVCRSMHSNFAEMRKDLHQVLKPSAVDHLLDSRKTEFEASRLNSIEKTNFDTYYLDVVPGFRMLEPSGNGASRFEVTPLFQHWHKQVFSAIGEIVDLS